MNSFSKYAQIYDRSRRQLIPRLDDFYQALLDQLPSDHQAPLNILDLGAGTGLLSACAIDTYPEAQLTLLDISEKMLSLARERFSGKNDIRYICADYSKTPLAGSYDIVVSALSIHHLDQDSKKIVFKNIYDHLKPGGLFINADQVLGETTEIHEKDYEEWIAQIKASDISQEDLDAAFERMKEDKMSTLADQLKWMKNVGFKNIECVYNCLLFSVYLGRK